jgi:hypothetical protein
MTHKYRKKKSKGLVDYFRSSGRKFRASKSMNDPEGKQFLKKDIPDISSKKKHTPGFSIQKQSKRKLNDSLNVKSHGELMNINPNYDYPKKRTCKKVPFIGKKSRVDYYSDRYKKIREKKFQKYFRLRKYNRNETVVIDRSSFNEFAEEVHRDLAGRMNFQDRNNMPMKVNAYSMLELSDPFLDDN